MTATEFGRGHGIHASTIRLWQDKDAGLETSDLARMQHIITRQACSSEMQYGT